MTSFLAAVRSAGVVGFNKNGVYVGDSMTNNFGATVGFPALIATHYSSTSIVKAHNGSGWISDGGTGSLPANAAEVDAVLASPAQTLVMFAGTNDLAGGSSVTDTINAWSSYVDARIAAGYVAAEMILCTMLPRSGSAFITETVRGNFNAAIVSLASSKGGSVCRLDLDSRIGLAGCNTDLTYYQSDQLHPNNAGLAVIAGLIEGIMG